MSNLWDKIRRFFRPVASDDDTAAQSNNPAIHQIIQRSSTEKHDFEQWKETQVKRRLEDWLYQQYALYRVLPDDADGGIDFLDTPSSKGFVIHFFKTNYTRREVTHFFDYLREQVLLLGYWPQLSDTRTYKRPEWIETIERHYLKPKPTFSVQKGPVSQGYGNITIENILRDGQPHYLKFRVNTYNDRLFLQPNDFQQLMDNLFV